MVPLHYDNMHIHVIDKHFLRPRKNDIFQRKNCNLSFFQTIDFGYTGAQRPVQYYIMPYPPSHLLDR